MIGENFVGKDVVLSILNKDSNSVTEAEMDILRARITYLTPEEKKRFGLVAPKPMTAKEKAKEAKAAAKAADEADEDDEEEE